MRERLMAYADHVGLLAEHGDVLGAAREGFVRIFLQETLPSAVDYKTGQILDSMDRRSGQIDVLLQSVNSPRLTLFGDVQVSLADCVIGAIEVKSDLTTAGWDNSSHLRSALQSSQKVKQLAWIEKTTAEIGGHNVELPSIPFFIVAYKGPGLELLQDRLKDFGDHFHVSLDEYAPDVVIVLEHNYYLLRNNGWGEPKEGEDQYITGDDPPLFKLFNYLSNLIECRNTWHSFTPFEQYANPLEE
jgi:hypothetical protein